MKTKKIQTGAKKDVQKRTVDELLLDHPRDVFQDCKRVKDMKTKKIRTGAKKDVQKRTVDELLLDHPRDVFQDCKRVKDMKTKKIQTGAKKDVQKKTVDELLLDHPRDVFQDCKRVKDMKTKKIRTGAKKDVQKRTVDELLLDRPRDVFQDCKRVKDMKTKKIQRVTKKDVQRRAVDEPLLDQPHDDFQDCKRVRTKKIRRGTKKDVRSRIEDELLLDHPNDNFQTVREQPSPTDFDLLVDTILSHSHATKAATNGNTQKTQRSHLPDSLASRTRGAKRKLDSIRKISPVEEELVGIPDISSQENLQEVGENINTSNTHPKQFLGKRVRGLTKMNNLFVNPQNRLDITFNKYGQPVGKNSIGLSSFLGPLVREVVPVTLRDWRKLSTSLKEVLWTSIQSRYNVKEDWQKMYLIHKIGRLWSAGKSRLVRQIQSAKTDEDLLKLKPDNIQSVHEWMEFVKEKNSAKFKEESERFKSMKKKQLPHTCSRKGFARMVDEMQNSCTDPSSVTRVAVWTKAHTKKNGHPVNSRVAEKLVLIEQADKEILTSPTNVDEDAISKVLGPDRAHIRGLGLGVTRSKLSTFSQKESLTFHEKEYQKIKDEMTEMKSLLSQLIKSQGQTSGQFSNATMNEPGIINDVSTSQPMATSPSSINNNNDDRKCKLLDWCGSGEVVAEGRWSSNDPKILVHHVPLGPLAVRVWVDVPTKPEAYLWRPMVDMTCIQEALGSTVAWPSDKVIMSS